MKKIWMIVQADLGKNKNQTISMVAMIGIAALFINISLVLFFGTSGFLQQKAYELNAPHFIGIRTQRDEGDNRLVHDFIANAPGVVAAESRYIISSNGGFYHSGLRRTGYMMLSRHEPTQTMNPPSLIGQHLPLYDCAIFIPHFMMVEGGFSIGDEFILDFWGDNHVFTVAGSTQEIFFGAQAATIWQVYIPHARFNEFLELYPNNLRLMTLAQMDTPADLFRLNAAFDNEFSTLWGGPGNSSITLSQALSWRTGNLDILATITIAFSVILLFVSIIAIRFRITNNIDEGMVNIGALKAMGFRNHQVITSVVLQFGLIALAGGIAGIILAQGALHFVGIMAEGVIGLVWRPVFVITYMLLVVIIIVPLVVAFSHLSARRIKHLHPLNALRGGILTHNFKKNHMPLDKSRGSLNFVLALKQLLHNKKQTIMIGLIVAALTFVSIAGLAAHYNLNVNHEEFMVLIGGELPDVYVAPNRGEYFDHAQFNADFREQMATHPDVRFINGRLQTAIFADGSMLIVWATENMSLLETNTTIRGRYPIHANEIAINFLSAEQRGLDVGDWMNVEIGADGYDYKPFVITGITQGGSGGMITGEGLSAVAPDFDSWSFFIYLTADACIETFGDELTSAWGEHLDNIMFPRTIALMQVETIGPIFAPIAYAMVGVTAAVVILVLYMVIKTTILRRRRDLGIQKALGFTTLQLMNQISLSITPPLLIGIITGAISGYLGFNPIFSAVSRGMGIAQTNLPVPALWTIAVCLGLILLAYATSLAISWTIRKISAYALITE